MTSHPEDIEGPYVWTASGKKVHFLTPSMDEISLHDIAHHLSQINRFTGGTKYPFSVAQHSLNVARYVQAKATANLMGVDVPVTNASVLQALFDDAAEAYLNDLASPIKHTDELAGYRKIEAGLKDVIKKKFNIVFPDLDCVKEADHIMVHAEASILYEKIPAWVDVNLAAKGKISGIDFAHRGVKDVRGQFMDFYIGLL